MQKFMHVKIFTLLNFSIYTAFIKNETESLFVPDDIEQQEGCRYDNN
jgi:hypothetical protein